jgi:hypothetical protein
MGWKAMDWISLAEDRYKLGAVVSILLNIGIS